MWLPGEKADYYREVILVVPGVAGGNTGANFTWLDQPDIRNARMIGMEAYFSSDLAYCFPNNVAVIPDNKANLVTLIFETNDPDDIDYKRGGTPGNFTGTLNTIQWLPLTALHVQQTQNGATSGSFRRSMIFWKNRYIIWQKSQIQLAPGGLNNTTDVAIVLGCYYSFLSEGGKPLPRN